MNIFQACRYCTYIQTYQILLKKSPDVILQEFNFLIPLKLIIVNQFIIIKSFIHSFIHSIAFKNCDLIIVPVFCPHFFLILATPLIQQGEMS